MCDAVARHQPRPHGTESIVALTAEPIVLERIIAAAVQVPGADVIEHRIACDIIVCIFHADVAATFADDHAQLHFPVQLLGVARHHYLGIGRGNAGFGFHEAIRRAFFTRRQFGAHLARMLIIIRRCPENPTWHIGHAQTIGRRVQRMNKPFDQQGRYCRRQLPETCRVLFPVLDRIGKLCVGTQPCRQMWVSL